ncbi:hypothetical protein LP421_18625 [Rhizobium sp. RCAM05350]|nr:hypothetical protein LP421_18625 [Rhizobium sp. RCAM05350]
MPTTIPTPQHDSPRGLQPGPGLPDRSQDRPTTPPVIDKGDTKNPNDPVLEPALLPIGDPAGMA